MLDLYGGLGRTSARAGVTMDWTETLRDCVGRLSREAATQTAVVGAGSPLTYADLHARALSLAAGFRGLGSGQATSSPHSLPNGVEFLTCYLATGYIGATLQTIHMPYRGAEVETLLAHSRAVAAVCLSQGKDASPAEIILSRKPKLPHLRHIIAVGPQAAGGAIAFASLAGATADEAALPPVSATDRFVLLYTSGTTAAPKGVPVDYARFLFNASRSASELEIDRVIDPALGRAAIRISTACSRSTSRSPPAPRPRSCRRSRRTRSPPRSMHAARPGCSWRRRTCRRA